MTTAQRAFERVAASRRPIARRGEGNSIGGARLRLVLAVAGLAALVAWGALSHLGIEPAADAKADTWHRWFIPYLPNFHVLRSEIDVQTTTSLDLDREDVDVAIHWGSGEPGHGVARAGFLAGLDLVRQAARDPGPVGKRAPAQAPGARATRAPVPRRRSGAW